jgi:predicted Zn-dependent protease
MAFNNRGTRATALAIVLWASVTSIFAQTEIKLPKNKYTPEQDVAIGREAAAEVRKKYPVISDERIARYLTQLGDRLVTAAPPELKQSVYEYCSRR